MILTLEHAPASSRGLFQTQSSTSRRGLGICVASGAMMLGMQDKHSEIHLVDTDEHEPGSMRLSLLDPRGASTE